MTSKPEAVADFRAGKQNAIGPLIGMIMKQVAGRRSQTGSRAVDRSDSGGGVSGFRFRKSCERTRHSLSLLADRSFPMKRLN